MADYFEPVTFSWNANTEDDLYEYVLKRASASGGIFKEVARIPAGTTQYTLKNLKNGTWYFVLTAVDESRNESTASEEIEVVVTEGVYDTTAPAAPTGLAQV